jgi:hypothetical protein
LSVAMTPPFTLELAVIHARAVLPVISARMPS